MPDPSKTKMRSAPEAPARDAESGLPLVPPGWFTALAITAMLLSFVMSPEILTSIGIVGRGLWSDRASVRNTTWVEVQVLRLSLMVIVLIAILWGRLVTTSMARRIAAVEPRERAWIDTPSALFNFSLFASLTGVVIAYFHHRYGQRIFSTMTLVYIEREDGIVEYGTAIFYFVAAVLAVILAYRSRTWKARAGMLALLAVLFVGVSGEEISWGQRIFDIKTPEFFEEHSIQQEFNLHNLFGYTADHVLYLSVLLYGGLVPFLAIRIPFLRKLCDWLGLPIASLGLAVGFLALSLYPLASKILISEDIRLRVDRDPALKAQYTLSLMSSELRELLTALCFLLLMIELWRRAPKDNRPAEPASAPA